MAKLFDRVCTLTVGPNGGEGREWSGLRVTFDVKKTGASAPNKADITIYNLNEDSRRFIKRGQVLLLMAGYADEQTTIFTGEVDVSNPHSEGGDWPTEIKAVDGLRAYTGTTFHESFAADTTEESILRAIAKKMGVTVGNLQGLSDKRIGRGRTLSGNARFELDALTRSRGLRWSIQDGVIQVLPIGAAATTSAVLLNADTGLIGSPERTEKGWKFQSLLRGGINPGQPLRVESTEVEGDFVAECVGHEGDTHGQPWYTNIEALTRK